MKSALVIVALLLLFAYVSALWGSSKTRKQNKSPLMKGRDNRAFMKKVGERAYSPENYDAYMDLNPHRQRWDRYSNKQKRQALSGFNDKYIKTNDLNVYSPTVDSINDALQPDSNKKTLNKAFGKVHQEVNQNLENMHFSYQSGLKNGNDPIPRPKTRRW